MLFGAARRGAASGTDVARWYVNGCTGILDVEW
jgi:hypothetical protein